MYWTGSTRHIKTTLLTCRSHLITNDVINDVNIVDIAKAIVVNTCTSHILKLILNYKSGCSGFETEILEHAFESEKNILEILGQGASETTTKAHKARMGFAFDTCQLFLVLSIFGIIAFC